MEPTGSVPGPARFVRWILLPATALALVALFAVTGDSFAGRALAVGLGSLFLLQFVSRLSATPFLVTLPLLLLTPNFGGWRLFDVVVLGLLFGGVLATVQQMDRRAYELHGPSWIAIAVLLAPLPGAVMAESLTSFLGSYKELTAYAIVFLSLRRLVTRSQSEALVWALPLLGLVAAGQLLVKTRGVGALLARSGFRNFYSSLDWGQSNAIAALLLVCLCGTALAVVLDRRPWVRIGLFASAGVMVQAFLTLSSRSATIALGLFVLILVLGLGGRFRLVALGAGVAIAAAGLLLSSGRLLLTRFSDPAEYASWTERQRLWEAAWLRFLDHPWFGIGLNQGRYYGDTMGSARAHNWVLDTLMEQGITGAIVLVIAVVAIFRLCARIRPTGERTADHRIRVVCHAFVSAVILQSLVEPTLLSYIVTVPFLWFLTWLCLQDPAGFASTPGPGGVLRQEGLGSG